MTKQELEKRLLELEAKYAELKSRVDDISRPPESFNDNRRNNGLKFG